MVMIEAIDIGDTEILHRLLLNERDPFLPLLYAGGTGAWGIEDRAHFPF